jgi:hypothetical protein
MWNERTVGKTAVNTRVELREIHAVFANRKTGV